MHKSRSVLLPALLCAVAGGITEPVRAADPGSLERRLQALQDHVEIEQLLMRYAAAFNTQDADA